MQLHPVLILQSDGYSENQRGTATGKDCMKRLLCAALRFLGLRRKTQITEDKDMLRIMYFDTGLYYHTTARFAVIEQFNPLAANLFHHAVEMYLKGALCRTLNEHQRRKLGHRLTKMWKRFKVAHPDPALNRFDQSISELDKYERIRYPEEILRRGMFSSINFSRSAQPVPSTTGPKRPEAHYDLFVDELDALAKEIFAKASVNAPVFTGRLRPNALRYLQNQNQSAIW
jgi:HEPN domain-containing protein